MPNDKFEQVQKLAEQLLPKDRLKLFGFLRNLLEAQDINATPSDSLLQEGTETGLQFDWHWSCTREGSEAIYYLDGVEIFRGIFQPKNFIAIRVKKEESRDWFRVLKEQAAQSLELACREELSRRGIEEVSQSIADNIADLAAESMARVLKESIEQSAKRMDDNLVPATTMVFRKVIEAALFSGANHLRYILDLKEYRAEEIKARLFKRDWERLKPIIGITHGGFREVNVKHFWTNKDRACLAAKYKRLLPIWQEAKRIAKAAKRSRDATRRRRWREAVLSIYPKLPLDLIEKLAAPRGAESTPSDIAIIHAGRECIPATYSTKRLKHEKSTHKAASQEKARRTRRNPGKFKTGS